MKSAGRDADPISTFFALEERIEKGTLPKVIAVVGASKGATEPFFGEQLIRVFKKRLEKEKGIDLFIHDPESEEFRLPILTDDLQSAPLFGGVKALIVRRADTLCRKSSRDGKEPTPFEKAFTHFLSREAPGHLLCLFDQIHSESPLFATANKNLLLFEARKLYSAPPPWLEDNFHGLTEVEKWIDQRSRAKKLPLAPPQRERVAQECGADLASIENELARLALAGPSAAVSIAAATPGIVGETTPKNFVDAVYKRDIVLAIQVLDTLYRKGFTDWSGSRIGAQALFPILSAALVQENRLLLQLKQRLEAGEPTAQAFLDLKVKKFAEHGLMRKLKEFSRTELRRGHRELLRMEREVKGGRVTEPRLALERFALQFCQKATQEIA